MAGSNAPGGNSTTTDGVILGLVDDMATLKGTVSIMAESQRANQAHVDDALDKIFDRINRPKAPVNWFAVIASTVAVVSMGSMFVSLNVKPLAETDRQMTTTIAALTVGLTKLNEEVVKQGRLTAVLKDRSDRLQRREIMLEERALTDRSEMSRQAAELSEVKQYMRDLDHGGTRRLLIGDGETKAEQ